MTVMSYNTLYLPWIDTLDRLRGSHVPEAEALRPQVVAEFHCRGLAGGGIQPCREPSGVYQKAGWKVVGENYGENTSLK